MLYQESEIVELKQEYTEGIRKEIIAFANTRGGSLYVGVKDNGEVAGVSSPDQIIQRIANMVRDSIRPDVTMFVKYKIRDDHVIQVAIGEGASKPYYLKRCLKLMKTLFFMVCYVLKNERIISPSFTARELRDMMRSPLSWRDVIGLDKWHLGNLLFVLLGKLPPSMSVFLVRQLGRRKGLV